MAKALGTDDSVNTCDCCGKSNLKFTVVIELDDGEIAHYGQVCARHNTGKAQKQITSELKAEMARKLAAALAEYLGTTERAALIRKQEERNRLSWNDPRRLGRDAYEFIRAENEADHAVRSSIAKKYGVSLVGY